MAIDTRPTATIPTTSDFSENDRVLSCISLRLLYYHPGWRRCCGHRRRTSLKFIRLCKVCSCYGNQCYTKRGSKICKDFRQGFNDSEPAISTPTNNLYRAFRLHAVHCNSTHAPVPWAGTACTPPARQRVLWCQSGRELIDSRPKVAEHSLQFGDSRDLPEPRYSGIHQPAGKS